MVRSANSFVFTFHLLCWLSLNNSETVIDVTLTFCSIQWLFITDIRTKFIIPNLSQCTDIGQNSDGGIFDIRISSQSFINENCHNWRTSDDIDMKLEPVTKLDKEKLVKPKKHLTMKSCRETVTLLSFFWFVANLQTSGDEFQTHSL